LRTIRGKLLVIWDGAPVAPIHRGQPVKDFLTRGAAKRLHLAQLPGDSPDRHPVEGLWNDLTRVELGNDCCSDLIALGRALRRGKERLRHKRHILQASLCPQVWLPCLALYANVSNYMALAPSSGHEFAMPQPLS
jgi:hypothetical protein